MYVARLKLNPLGKQYCSLRAYWEHNDTLSMIQHYTVLRSGLPYTTVGEVRNLPPPARELRGREGRDSYVVVALDSEEIFRTVTAEKTLRWVCGCVCAHVQKRKVSCTPVLSSWFILSINFHCL